MKYNVCVTFCAFPSLPFPFLFFLPSSTGKLFYINLMLRLTLKCCHLGDECMFRSRRCIALVVQCVANYQMSPVNSTPTSSMSTLALDTLMCTPLLSARLRRNSNTSTEKSNQYGLKSTCCCGFTVQHVHYKSKVYHKISTRYSV